jgi:signal peptidase I
MTKTTRIRILSTLVGVMLIIDWGMLLRPTFLGGPASYIVVSGHSMEPMLHTGDLAVARRQPSYHKGDIVVYQADGGRVIHRIIGGSAESGFITQGINRKEPDIWRPTPAQIYGSMWFHVPHVGLWVAAFRTPSALGALCAALVALSLFSSAKPTPRKSRAQTSPT